MYPRAPAIMSKPAITHCCLHARREVQPINLNGGLLMKWALEKVYKAVKQQNSEINCCLKHRNKGLHPPQAAPNLPSACSMQLLHCAWFPSCSTLPSPSSHPGRMFSGGKKLFLSLTSGKLRLEGGKPRHSPTKHPAQCKDCTVCVPSTIPSIACHPPAGRNVT